jgi:hypothetical protein
MAKPALYYLTSVLILIIFRGISSEFIQLVSVYPTVIQQNPTDKGSLLNGRIWRNQYSKAIGDQFFLTNTFLKGSVTSNGRRFDNLDLKYDITNDELVLRIESYPVIIMNKELVDSFNLFFENRIYHIINAGTDTSNVLRGYANVLYDGPSTLYVKYTKKIHPLAVDGRYDLFYQEHSVYLRKGTEILPIAGKRKFLNLLEDKKKEIRYYRRSSRLKLMKKDPDTFVPVLRYYDSISK